MTLEQPMFDLVVSQSCSSKSTYGVQNCGSKLTHGNTKPTHTYTNYFMENLNLRRKPQPKPDPLSKVMKHLRGKQQTTPPKISLHDYHIGIQQVLLYHRSPVDQDITHLVYQQKYLVWGTRNILYIIKKF